MNSQIVYLNLRSLNAHPDNPRKDLGDLTELAESIRVKGVMQNLTVVPMQEGVCQSCSSYVPQSPRLCSRDDTKNERVPCSKWESAGRYTIVIGHRRAAAARKAGVETVPCVISDMDSREQIETMLLENMQRSDLTVIEQARGFQMMLDFGSSIEDVAQRTGFSASTVRRRVKLMELDQKHLERAVARGGSLMDYMELEKIADPALRDEVLCAIGTDNFKGKLSNALREEQQRASLVEWEAIISTFAQKIEKRDYIGDQYFSMDYHRNYYAWDGKGKKIEIPDDVGSAKYFYIVTSNQIYVYREHEVKTDPAAEAKKIADDEFRNAIKRVKEISSGHYRLRMEFVRDFSNYKKHMQEISMLVGIALIYDGFTYNDGADRDAIMQLLDLKIENRASFADVLSVIEGADVFTTYPERAIFTVAYASVDANEKYWESKWNPNQQRSELVHRKNPKLDMIYAILRQMGYQMSDEEYEMQNGMHEMLVYDIEDVDDDDEDSDADDFDDDSEEDEEDE